MVQIGGIVSVGGGAATGGGGSGVTTINPGTNIGPTVEFQGVNGVQVIGGANIVLIDGVGASGAGGGVGGPQSGVIGVNGIDVQQVGGEFVVDGASLSGLLTGGTSCHTQSFIATTSGQFTHNLNSRNLVIQVYNDAGPPEQIFPDRIILDTLEVFSVLFNTPQAGTVVAVECTASTGSQKYSVSFSSVTGVVVNHNLGSVDVLVQVRDNSTPKQQIIPDKVIHTDSNNITLQFNSQRSGRVTVIG